MASHSEFLTPSRLISKLQKVSISAKYNVTYEFGFQENEKLTVIEFCEKATNSKKSDFEIAKQIHENLETLENNINFMWYVTVTKNELNSSSYSSHHRGLTVAINGYKIFIYGFKNIDQPKKILELARKNISKLEITESNISDNDKKEVIYNEVKYAIKYCDSFYDIAKHISNELRNSSKTKENDWNVIVNDACSSLYTCERIYFNLDKILPIYVYSSKK